MRESADLESLTDADRLAARCWPFRCGVCRLGLVPLIRPRDPMLFQWLTSKQAGNGTRPAGRLPPTRPPLCCRPFDYICERDLWVFAVTCLLWSCWGAISLKLLQKEHRPPCEKSRSHYHFLSGVRANIGYRGGESLSQKDAYQILGQNEEQCLKFANEQDLVLAYLPSLPQKAIFLVVLLISLMDLKGAICNYWDSHSLKTLLEHILEIYNNVWMFCLHYHTRTHTHTHSHSVLWAIEVDNHCLVHLRLLLIWDLPFTPLGFPRYSAFSFLPTPITEVSIPVLVLDPSGPGPSVPRNVGPGFRVISASLHDYS